MNGDVERAGIATLGVAALGLSQTGPAGLGFLVEPVAVPLWFLIAAVAMPFGELMALSREIINRRRESAERAE